MQALDRAIRTLEQNTGFSRAFHDLVVRRGGWPNRWMTPAEIDAALTRRGFWEGPRRDVLPDARVRLITHYLDRLIDAGKTAGSSSGDTWKGSDSGGGSSFGLPGRDASALGSEWSESGGSGGGWQRFDGQYKHAPKTKLVEYRGARMGRSFDRRNYLRVVVRDTHTQYGPVLNLSPGGLMFCVADPEHEKKFRVGGRGFLRLTCTAAEPRVSIRVRCKIVWMSPTEYGTRVGVDFRGLTPDDQKSIARVIAEAGDPDDDTYDRRKTR
ncbi:MAG: PilZ domain-containing protein [Planctomycetota bacterium]